MINLGIKTGLQDEEIYMKIFQERKINLSFKDTIKISPRFAKFLRGIIAQLKSKPLALLPSSVYVGSLGIILDNKRLYMAKTLRAKV